MATTTSPGKSARLASLDILRGFDLFMLVFLQPILISAGGCYNEEWYQNLLWHFDHETWQGFRAWDLVMPLFLFMTGAAMPFSFAKYHKGIPRTAAWRHILWRVAVLWILGMLVQGNLLLLDITRLLPYTNTLQAIAAGYLIGSILILYFSPRTQLYLTLALLLLYSLPMSLCGDFSPTGNFAYKVDLAILGDLRGDVTYTWIWSSLTFAVTVMMGSFATRIIKHRHHATTRLMTIGAAMIALGLLWNFETPIIKRIWSGSMTIYSGGLCFILLGIAYYIIDVRKYSKGLNWLKIYGMNSITAYILGEVVNFRSIPASLTFGLEPYIGCWYQTWLTTANYLIVMAILWYMYKTKIFVKI